MNVTLAHLFGFDALILAILAVGSAFGARTIFRLRRQVSEAGELGQYRLKRRIGTGGMAEVYLAEHQLLRRPCAVKLTGSCRPVVARRVWRPELSRRRKSLASNRPARYRQDAQGSDTEHLQAGSRQTARDHGRKTGVSLSVSP
jgi:hypothetical protein